MERVSAGARTEILRREEKEQSQIRRATAVADAREAGRLAQTEARERTKIERQRMADSSQIRRDAAKFEFQVQRDASRDLARLEEQRLKQSERLNFASIRQQQRAEEEGARNRVRLERETQRQLQAEQRAEEKARLESIKRLDRAAAASAKEREREAKQVAKAEAQATKAVEAKRSKRANARSQLAEGASDGASLAGAGILGGLGLAVNEAVQWEAAFAGVSKTVNATSKELAGLESGLRSLSTTIPVSAEELAGIAENAGQLGIETKSILKFTRVMADLSKATNLSSEEAANWAGKFANITKMPPSQVDKLGSALVQLGNNGASTEKDIAAMSLRIAGAGAQIGLTQPQILAFASALSSAGIEAELGGTSISKVFKGIDAAVRGGGKSLDLFAKTSDLTANQFKQLFEKDAAGAVLKFTEGLSHVKRAGGDVFGTLEKLGFTGEGVSDTLLRMSNNSKVLAQSLRDGNKGWAENTALTEEARKRYATTAAQLEITQNQLRDLGITAGQTVIPALNDLLKASKPLFDIFEKMSPETRENTVRWVAYGAAALLVGGRIKSAIEIFGVLKTATMAVRGATIASTAATGANTVATEINAAASGRLGVGLSALRLRMLASTAATAGQTSGFFALRAAGVSGLGAIGIAAAALVAIIWGIKTAIIGSRDAGTMSADALIKKWGVLGQVWVKGGDALARVLNYLNRANLAAGESAEKQSLALTKKMSAPGVQKAPKSAAWIAAHPGYNAQGVKIDGSHAKGLPRVPKDGYIAELHKDEAVLTAKEAASWRGDNVRGGSARDRENPYVLAARGMVGLTGRSRRAAGAAYGKEWCIGFLQQVNKDVTGESLARGALSVDGLRSWGRKSGRAYTGRPRVGDYATIKGYGKTKSHGALVSAVYNDGTFGTIGGNEGNENNFKSRVKEGNRYRWNHGGIVFVRSTPVKGGAKDDESGAANYVEPKKPYVAPYVTAKHEANEELAQARKTEADAARLHAQRMAFAAKNGVGPALDEFTERLEKVNSLWRDENSPVVKLFKNRQFGSANAAFAQLMGAYDADVARKKQMQGLADGAEARKKREDDQAEALKQGSEAFQSVTAGAYGERDELAQRGQWMLEGKGIEQINELLEEQAKWRARVAELRASGYDQNGAARIADETQAQERQNRALRAQMDAEEERLRDTPQLVEDALGKLPSLSELVASATQQLNDAMDSGSNDAAQMRSALGNLPPVLQNVIDNMNAGGLAADGLRTKYSDFFSLLARAQGEIGRREKATANALAQPFQDASDRLSAMERELDIRLGNAGGYDFKTNRRREITEDLDRDGLPVDAARVDKIVNREAWVGQVESVMNDVHNVFERSFGDVSGGFSGMCDNMLDGFSQMMQQMAAEYLANWAMQQLMGAFIGKVAPVADSGSTTGDSPLSANPLGWEPRPSGAVEADGAHAAGLDRVPRDNYVGVLHKNEAVLNAAQAESWRQQQRAKEIAIAGSNAARGGASSDAGAVSSSNDVHLHLNGPVTVQAQNTREMASELVGKKLPRREMKKRVRNGIA